jgi:hypothetical protein
LLFAQLAPKRQRREVDKVLVTEVIEACAEGLPTEKKRRGEDM